MCAGNRMPLSSAPHGWLSKLNGIHLLLFLWYDDIIVITSIIIVFTKDQATKLSGVSTRQLRIQNFSYARTHNTFLNNVT